MHWVTVINNADIYFNICWTLTVNALPTSFGMEPIINPLLDWETYMEYLHFDHDMIVFQHLKKQPEKTRESSHCLVFYHLELLSKVRGHTLRATFSISPTWKMCHSWLLGGCVSVFFFSVGGWHCHNRNRWREHWELPPPVIPSDNLKILKLQHTFVQSSSCLGPIAGC